METFSVFMLFLKDPLTELGEIIEIYIAQVHLLMHLLLVWGTLNDFYREQKRQFWAKFSTRFSNGAV